MPNFPQEEPILDPEAFLRGLGLPTEGADNDQARQVIADHAQVIDRVWAEEMRRKGEALVRYLNTPESEGGPGPATDDETARPSPFSNLSAFDVGAKKVE